MTLNFWDTNQPIPINKNSFEKSLEPMLETREQRIQRVLNPQLPLFRTNTSSELDVDFSDTYSAQMGYSYMPIINAITNWYNFDEDDRDQNFNPFAHMQGYEEYSDYLKDAVNEKHMNVLKEQLEANIERRHLLEHSSLGSQLIAGIFDPINLIPLPFGQFAKGAIYAGSRIGTQVAGITALAEAARYPFDPLATPEEVGANIGMSFVGGALLGGTIGFVAGRKLKKAINELEADEAHHINLAKEVSESTEKAEVFVYNEETMPIEELIKRGDKDQLQSHELSLPNRIAKIKEVIKTQEKHPDIFTNEVVEKSFYNQRKELREKIANEKQKVKNFVLKNKELQKSVEGFESSIGKIKKARDEYSVNLKNIKKRLIDQAEGRSLTIGLTKKQLDFLSQIKSKEANKFFTPKQKKAVNILIKKIEDAQKKIETNKKLLATKREGNIVFLGDKQIRVIQEDLEKVTEVIRKNNRLTSNYKQLSRWESDYQKTRNELKQRKINEDALYNAEGVLVNKYNLTSDTWYGRLYLNSPLFKGVPTPVKYALQHKILPQLSKKKHIDLAGDNALNLEAHKHGEAISGSVNTKAIRRNGEYVKVHDKLRKLYSEHTGKNQVYLDYDFQKRGYHEWLENTYTKILKGESLSDLDKKVKSVTKEFWTMWEERARKQGIIGDSGSIKKSITKKELDIINYTKKLRDVVRKAATEFELENANIIIKDAESILTGVRKQTRYKNTKSLSIAEIQERFGDDYNIKKLIDDPKLLDEYRNKNPDVSNTLGFHVFYDQKKGDVYIDEAGIRERWRILTKGQKEEFKETFYQKYLSQYIPEEKKHIGTMHLKFEYDNYKYFDSYDDLYDFIVFHELTHGKYKQFKNETLFDFEYRTNELALERLLMEKEQFNPITQGMVLGKKTMKDLDSLKKLKYEKGLSPDQVKYKNNVINYIKEINEELIGLRKNLKDAEDTKILPKDVEDFFPRYWNVEKIKENREQLAEILTQWFMDNPTVFKKNKNGNIERTPALTPYETMKATDPANVLKRVNQSIDNIIKNKNDVTEDEMAFFGHGKSKHFRHRNLDIPNKLVTDFIITNPVQVMQVYTKKVAPKYEFMVKFEGKNIDEVMRDLTLDNYQAGMSEIEVNKINKNFLHLYDRVVGNVIKNPDRWDQTAVIILRDLAQLSFLGSSGFSTLPDLAKILMEHEIGNVMKGLTGILQDSRVRMTAKEGRLAGEILEILQGDVHLRNVEDLTNTPLAQGYQLKMSKVRNLFFGLNGLAPMTNLMKKLDSVIRQHEMIDFVIKEINGTAKASDITYLRRYGISNKISKDIKKLVDKDIIQNTKDGNGLWLANTEKWIENGVAEESLDAFRDSLNTGIMNTILMATPADKPIIADGVVYIPKWIGEKFGMKEDIRFKGYTRIETGLAGLPFQFWSYSFAAANKITAAIATGQAKNRAAAVTSAIALGYVSLEIKSRFSGPAIEAMFDNMSWEDKLARSIDSSGLLAMYSDLFYTAMDTSLALGGPDISMGLLQPKVPRNYKDMSEWERSGEVIGAVGGAGPSIGIELFKGAKQFVEGNYGYGSKQIIKNLPFMRLWFIKEMTHELGSVLTDIEDEGLERVVRTRF